MFQDVNTTGTEGLDPVKEEKSEPGAQARIYEIETTMVMVKRV